VSVDETSNRPAGRGRIGGSLGLLSAVMLAAAVRWAHHLNARGDAIVAVWALATIAAMTVSTWSLQTSQRSRSFAKIGIVFAVISLLALAVVGMLYAAGASLAGSCGGG
jgi:hypothetical protein